MPKVDWLAAGVFLKPISLGFFSDQKRWRRICEFFQPMGKAAASTNNKQENVTKTQADNVIKRCGVFHEPEEILIYFFPKQGHLKNFKKTCVRP
jgi:hypothetical protein